MSRITLSSLAICAGLALSPSPAAAQYRPTGIGPAPSPRPQREWRAVDPYDRAGPQDRDRYDRDHDHDHGRYDRDHDHHGHDHHDYDFDDRRPAGPSRPSGQPRTGGAFGPFGAVIDYGPGKVIVQPNSVIIKSDDRDNRSQLHYGSRHVPTATIRDRADSVRRSYNHRDVLNSRWYESHRTAWQPRQYANRSVYASVSWNSVRDFCHIPDRPVYYDYGRTVVFNGDMVYVNGAPSVAVNAYFDQAAQIAAYGRRTRIAPEATWQSLGVFALVREDQTWAAVDHFQIAINEQGILRGNYFNTRTGGSQPLFGAVDLRSQRAVWTLADNLTPLYDTGIANLTQGETVMMAHFDRARSGQYLLIRVPQPN